VLDNASTAPAKKQPESKRPRVSQDLPQAQPQAKRRLDLIDDLIKIDMGQVYRAMLSSTTVYGYMFVIAMLYISTLLASSYVERVNSAANLAEHSWVRSTSRC
jgi:hypothetical protein